eukprot:2873647-Pyramimonas_sp.AAC.1
MTDNESRDLPSCMRLTTLSSTSGFSVVLGFSQLCIRVFYRVENLLGFRLWRVDVFIIAAMTVGKDVSSLFPDVVNCMQTENLELKKLVYLYLINYAKSQPDLAIMAVNTFVK